MSATTWPLPRRGDGLSGMLVVSAVGHAVLIALFAGFAHEMQRSADRRERTVMTISLGGAPGPRSGGMTAMGGRPVQQVAPPEARPPVRPEPVKAPAERRPAMVLPTKERPVPRQATPPATAPVTERPRATAPLTGPELRAGSAVAQTGGQGLGFGLSTGGGGSGGEIDIGTFCCPDYLVTMRDLILRNWNSRQQVAGISTIRFTVRRDGSVTDVEVARSSGYAVLDLSAQRAIAMSRFPPLPSAYTNERLTINLTFEYQR
jgi:TonB family protein